MAKTRRPLQWDDVNENDVVILFGRDGSRVAGTFRGYVNRFPFVRLEDDQGKMFSVHMQSVCKIAVLRPVEKNRGDP